MKKIILFIFLFYSAICLCQERINTELPIISGTISELNYAKGWIYKSRTEQWEGRDNKILAEDKFNKYEFINIEYKGENYIGFIVYYKGGYFKYPSIQKEYVSVDIKECYLINENKYKENIEKFNNDSIGIIKIKTLKPFTIISYQEKEKLQKQFAEEINKGKELNETHYLIIQYRKFKNKNLTQFLFLKQSCKSYSFKVSKKDKKEGKDQLCLYYFLSSPTSISEYIHDFSKEVETNEIFNYLYYECNYNDLDKFINLSK